MQSVSLSDCHSIDFENLITREPANSAYNMWYGLISIFRVADDTTFETGRPTLPPALHQVSTSHLIGIVSQRRQTALHARRSRTAWNFQNSCTARIRSIAGRRFHGSAARLGNLRFQQCECSSAQSANKFVPITRIAVWIFVSSRVVEDECSAMAAAFPSLRLCLWAQRPGHFPL